MKKTIHIILTIVAIVFGTVNSPAANPNGNMMISSTQGYGSTTRFVIEGNVDLNIADSCYNIYIADMGDRISDNNIASCVKVKDKKFRFETDINVMKQGRLRALFPGGKKAPKWIDIFFIPGFTVYMTIHDGQYDIHNEDQYKFMVLAWQNEIPVSALLARLGMESQDSKMNKTTKMTVAIANYEKLLSDLKQQMNDINHLGLSYDDRTKELKKILARIENINTKMEALINEYTNSIY